MKDAVVSERMLMHIPNAVIDLPTFSERDEADIEFALKNGVDMISASYLRSANCVETLREILGARGSHVKILAKIQN